MASRKEGREQASEAKLISQSGANSTATTKYKENDTD